MSQYLNWEEEAERRARYHAGEIVKNKNFDPSEIDDLTQDYLVKFLSVLPKFDPKKKKLITFIERVFKNFGMNLIRERKKWLTFESMENHVNDFEDESWESNYAASDGGTTIHDIDLRIDLARALKGLSLPGQAVMGFLAYGNGYEISMHCGIPRSWMDLHKRQLRKDLIAFGIRPYAARRVKEGTLALVFADGAK